MSDKDEYIRRLDKIERDIEWIIQYLLKTNEPSSPPPYVPPVTPKASTICSKCGMKWEGVMSYYCSSINCPVQYTATSQVSYATGTFDVESLDPDKRTWYYDGDGTKRLKE